MAIITNKVQIGLIDKLARDLIKYLDSLPLGSHIGNWTYNGKISSIIRISKEERHLYAFINVERKKLELEIWLTGDRINSLGVYNYDPFRWYISIYNEVPNDITHHISLHDTINHINISHFGSDIIENYKNLVNKSIKPNITNIKYSNFNWKEDTIKNILDHEILREKIHKKNPKHP